MEANQDLVIALLTCIIYIMVQFLLIVGEARKKRKWMNVFFSPKQNDL